jgi:hypothetical protein
MDGTNRNVTTQKRLIEAYEAINVEVCRQRDWPEARAKRAAIRQARDFLGEDYVPGESTPTEPPVSWDQRNLAEPESKDPTKFLDKHWGRYLDEGVLDQCTFRKLDPKLFEAIKWWCQKHELKLAAHLPPPARQHKKSDGDEARPAALHIDKAKEEPPRAKTAPKRPVSKRLAQKRTKSKSPASKRPVRRKSAEPRADQPAYMQIN